MKEKVKHKRCNCKKPKIESVQVTDRLPSGFTYQHFVNGNICLKCGKLL